ncbi:MAG: hypothetical protein KAT00_03380 [Planctomycetes bacterium]|nr:hypothetical protein [Planctomycetota bacterium]
MIKHQDGKWVLYSKDGSRVLGKFDTEEEAKKREGQIQFFKSHESLEPMTSILSDDIQLLEQGDVQSLISTWGTWAGSFSKCVSELKGKPGITDADALCAWMKHEATGKWPAEEAATDTVANLREAGFEYQDTHLSNIADWLEAAIHQAFTIEADGLLGGGHIDRDERLALSDLIGKALKAFSAGLDGTLSQLRTKPIQKQVQESYAEQRDLSDVWARDITEATIDARGNLSGIIVVEGESKRGNVYTRAALESGRQIFAGKPIFADHPSRSEDRDRPERSVRDLVGKLPTDLADLWVAPITEGPYAGKQALFYKNGTLSKTAGWLKTLLQEKIAGAQSINAYGGGDMNQDGKFRVEAFLAAKSLDFVTSASAGGEGHVQESDRDTQTTDEETITAFLEAMTIGDLAKLRPDIVNDVAKRERAKAYGEKVQLIQEAKMSKKLTSEVRRLRESVVAVMQQARKQRADELTAKLLAASPLPAGAHAHVRTLVEGQVRRFVEQEEPAVGDGEATVAIVPSPDLEASDPPTIEVPPEVPEDKRTEWVTAYLEATEAGTEPAQAVHVAWAAIISGGETEVPEEVAGEMVDVFTEAQLAEAIHDTITTEAKYISTMTGAGQIMGMGSVNAQALLEQLPEVDEDAEIASWQKLGLTEAEARIAHIGRGRNL